MDLDINLIILFVLILLAIIDLTVGVANDAVNFLNAAVGSRAAKLRTILIVASIGVLAGVMLSGGMMKIARSGIFDPGFFLMPELLIIFVAAMLQDILLLDTYNTLGLPTSTTVSVVFGLFGGSLGITIIKLATDAIPGATLFDYMQLDDVLKIVTGIFLSVGVAFIVGFLIQFLSRLIFSFSYKDKFRKFGGVWGSLALSSISLFIILKGLKNVDSSFIDADVISYIKNNLSEVTFYLILGWFVILQPLISFTKVNVLKLIVMAGTFSLGMAFAANDLVNFIGAPLAALNTYELSQTYGNLAETTLMGDLESKAQANKLYVLIAGVIMMITLFVSKKARSVTATTINLSSQESSKERFKSNAIGRFLVRNTLALTNVLDKMISPNSRIRKSYQRSFDYESHRFEDDKSEGRPAFDLIRAAVILMVSAGLISIATTLTLPLSTTYVTFIVAMAAALPDRAWGRETAVFRVSGVINVIAGWFGTALIAMLVAGIIAVSIYYGELIALFFFLLITAGVLISSTLRHRREEKASKMRISSSNQRSDLVANAEKDPLQNLVSRFLYQTEDILDEVIESFGEYDKGLAKKCVADTIDLSSEVEDISKLCYRRISKSQAEISSKVEDKSKESEISELELTYIKIDSEVRGIFEGIDRHARNVFVHIDNLQKPLPNRDASVLYEICKELSLMLKQEADELKSERKSYPKEFLPQKKQIVFDIISYKSKAINESASMISTKTIDLYIETFSLMNKVAESSYQLFKDINKLEKLKN